MHSVEGFVEGLSMYVMIIEGRVTAAVAFSGAGTPFSTSDSRT